MGLYNNSRKNAVYHKMNSCNLKILIFEINCDENVFKTFVLKVIYQTLTSQLYTVMRTHVDNMFDF